MARQRREAFNVQPANIGLISLRAEVLCLNGESATRCGTTLRCTGAGTRLDEAMPADTKSVISLHLEFNQSTLIGRQR